MKITKTPQTIVLILLALVMLAGTLIETGLAFHSSKSYQSTARLSHPVVQQLISPPSAAVQPASEVMVAPTAVTSGYLASPNTKPGKPAPKPFTPAPVSAFVYANQLDYYADGLNSYSCQNGGSNTIHATARLESTRAATATYQWFRSDGQLGPSGTVTFAAAETKTIQNTWTMTGDAFNGHIYVRITSGAMPFTSAPRSLYYDLYC